MNSILKVYSWKPQVGLNFGDHIGPLIVQKLVDQVSKNIEVMAVTDGDSKLLSVGSILHEARSNDFVWGSGVNGKTWLPNNFANIPIDFCSVRGPITRASAESFGHKVPEVFGDPGLLFPFLFADEIQQQRQKILDYYEARHIRHPVVCFIPNINDERFFFPELKKIPKEWFYVSPSCNPFLVAAYISLSEKVISSSLHGVVFADAMGKDCSVVQSRFEPILKYDDYFLGTDRSPVTASPTLEDIRYKGQVKNLKGSFDHIIDAFPFFCPTKNIEQLTYKIPLISTELENPVDGDDSVRAITKLMFCKGWSEPTSGSIWSIGNQFVISFRVKRSPQKRFALRLMVGTLSKGVKSYEKIRILNHSQVPTSFPIERNKPAHVIEIPLEFKDDSSDMVTLRGTVENPTIPKQSGISEDIRALGIWVSWYQLIVIAN